MRKFEFSDNNNIQLDIAGNQFSVSFSLDLINKLIPIGKKSIEYSEKIDNGEDQIKVAKSIILLIRECLDEILGNGACQKIFSGRKENFYDYIEVILFVSEELENYRVQKEQKQIEFINKLNGLNEKNGFIVEQPS